MTDKTPTSLEQPSDEYRVLFAAYEAQKVRLAGAGARIAELEGAPSAKGTTEPMRQQASAWGDVVEVLNELSPGWSLTNAGSGSDMAVTAIRKLVAPSGAGERDAIIEECAQKAYDNGGGRRTVNAIRSLKNRSTQVPSSGTNDSAATPTPAASDRGLAWIATKGDQTLHFSLADGWEVHEVMCGTAEGHAFGNDQRDDKRDAERLDWFEQTNPMFDTVDNGWLVWVSDNPDVAPLKGKTLRAAIDAAMSAGRTK